MNMSKYCFYPILILIIAVSVICVSCGYHFRANGEAIGIEIDSIAIPMMTSTSSAIGFESDFTGIIRQEFISRSKMRILPKEKAQFVLTGHVYEISTEPLSFNQEPISVGGATEFHETTNSRRMKIKLDVRLVERETGEIIWYDRSMEEKAGYNVQLADAS